MSDDVVYFDFRRKSRRPSPGAQLAEYNLPVFSEDLNSILEILEAADNISALGLNKELEYQVEFLSHLCDQIAEECHRLGFDIKPEFDIIVDLESEDY